MYSHNSWAEEHIKWSLYITKIEWKWHKLDLVAKRHDEAFLCANHNSYLMWKLETNKKKSLLGKVSHLAQTNF